MKKESVASVAHNFSSAKRDREQLMTACGQGREDGQPLQGGSPADWSMSPPG